MSFLKKRSTRFYLGGFLLMMLALWWSHDASALVVCHPCVR